MTVHPGIGYDIISNHPIFSGAVIGRAAELDFKLFGGAVEGLDGGVVLSVGSAIMGPQVFEKSLSCVNNLRLQARRAIVRDHQIYVVDLQDGGGWDWTQGGTAEDQRGLLPALLQELLPHGRADALSPMRQRGVHSSPLSRASARMTPERLHEIAGRYARSCALPSSATFASTAISRSIRRVPRFPSRPACRFTTWRECARNRARRARSSTTSSRSASVKSSPSAFAARMGRGMNCCAPCARCPA